MGYSWAGLLNLPVLTSGGVDDWDLSAPFYCGATKPFTIYLEPPRRREVSAQAMRPLGH